MRLYLVRHGKAEFGAEEADRHLSERGMADVQAVARHLGNQGIRVEQVLHSTLTRARQTAEIIGAVVAPGVKVSEMPGIEPWGDVQDFARVVEDWERDTMVCGHEPFMGAAASLLLGGSAHADLLVVKTGTIIALERAHYREGWQLRWMLTPRMVRNVKKEEDA